MRESRRLQRFDLKLDAIFISVLSHEEFNYACGFVYSSMEAEKACCIGIVITFVSK